MVVRVGGVRGVVCVCGCVCAGQDSQCKAKQRVADGPQRKADAESLEIGMEFDSCRFIQGQY